MELKGLVLAGGQSTRMGQPKGLLQLDNEPLYIRAIRNISPFCSSVSLSLRPEQMATFSPTLPGDVEVIQDEAGKDIGPAAGLLSAHKAHPDAHWLVFACDFPLATSGTFEQLVKSYQEPLTCFYDVMAEPLFAIWSPVALRVLHSNVTEKNRTGPMATVKQVLAGEGMQPGGRNLILAERKEWLRNSNTPEEWQEVLRIHATST